MKLKVFRIRENAKLPVRAHPTDAGMDLFFCPENNEPKNVYPGNTELFATGLKIGVPPGYMLEIKNKSGVAYKQQLVVGACVVDSGYDGEVFVNLHNIGNTVKVIEQGQKLAQAVMVPIETPQVEEITEDNVYGSDTDRGDGGFGSTGIF